MENAKVVCRQLGYPVSFPEVYADAYYGKGTGKIWLNFVDCQGFESMLSTCSHSGWAVGGCTHRDDVSVSCCQFSCKLSLKEKTCLL